jgi:hypothetical protein
MPDPQSPADDATDNNETAPIKAPKPIAPPAPKPKRGFERNGPSGVRQPPKHANNRRAPIGWRGGAR